MASTVWTTPTREGEGAIAASPVSEPLGRGRRIAYIVVFGILGVSLLGLLLVHLPHGASKATGHDASATTNSTVAQGASNTSTSLAVPSAPKPDADTAANALVSSWASGNRANALAVATPAAVTTLFAAHYAAGLVEDRGCSTAFTPIVCTFGPPGGASPSDAIYQLDVSQAPGGWYVSAVKVQN